MDNETAAVAAQSDRWPVEVTLPTRHFFRWLGAELAVCALALILGDLVHRALGASGGDMDLPPRAVLPSADDRRSDPARRPGRAAGAVRLAYGTQAAVVAAACRRHGRTRYVQLRLAQSQPRAVVSSPAMATAHWHCTSPSTIRRSTSSSRPQAG